MSGEEGLLLAAGDCVVTGAVGHRTLVADERLGTVHCFIKGRDAARRRKQDKHDVMFLHSSLRLASTADVRNPTHNTSHEQCSASGWSSMAPDDDETAANMEAYIEQRLEAIGAAGSGGGGGGSGEGGGAGSLVAAAGTATAFAAAAAPESRAAEEEAPVGLVERLLVRAGCLGG
jgi:hypothetical protein